MVMVDRLLGRSGDVRQILGISQPSTLDLSDAEGWSRLEVLRGLKFHDVFVLGAEIGLDLVACRFTDCVFKRIRSDAHFWGADDLWTNCRFDESTLDRMISPMNSFRDCRFESSMLTNFKPYQTLFENCSFTDFIFEGMKAQLTENQRMVNPALRSNSGTVVFRRCRFLQTSFRQSYFEGAVFEACEFANISLESCDFQGIISDSQWWGSHNDDPFMAFLSKALDLIDKKCGKESQAYHVFRRYVTDYGTGKTQNKDFSACLYSEKVPYNEVQRISKELRRLVNQFPF